MALDIGKASGRGGVRSATSLGTLVGALTYSMWGLFPLYWKRLSGIEAFQVLSHRIVWAAAFCILLLVLTGRLGVLAEIARSRKRLLVAALAAFLVTINWGVYIWAVNAGHIIDSALGYYINPLFSVAFGAIFLRERLDRFTIAAVSIAAAGVIAATVMLGRPPIIPLVLGSSFGLYGLVKKKAALDPVAGLAVETLVLSPFALAFLLSRHLAGAGGFGGPDGIATLMLALAGPVTAIPLMTFAFATNRITLQRLGFVQYISPSLQLLLGIFLYRESISPAMTVAFVSVFVAVIIYAGTRRRL